MRRRVRVTGAVFVDRLAPTMFRQRGVTLVELIAVLTLAGILSAFAAIRMLDRGLVDARGFADELASTVRFAQKAAVAQRRLVFVNIDAAARSVRVCLDAAPACAQPLAEPAGGPLQIAGAGSVTMTSGVTQFSFDGLGRPSLGAPLTLTATGGATSFAVTVEPETGYVRRA
jgi:MSHA pilin protein MshC